MNNWGDIFYYMVAVLVILYFIHSYYRRKLIDKHCQQLVEIPEFREEIAELMKEFREADYSEKAAKVGDRCQLDFIHGHDILERLKTYA